MIRRLLELLKLIKPRQPLLQQHNVSGRAKYDFSMKPFEVLCKEYGFDKYSRTIKNEPKLHAKPSLYAYYFEILKEIANEYGYNLVLHGSMSRDLDLIAIPWQEIVKPHLPMIEQFAEVLGGEILPETQECRNSFAIKYHGRYNYIININRDLIMKYQGMGTTEIKNYSDPQYYIDVSVTPMIKID